ncbi:MAG: hypothetical protein JW791_00880 [Nanoarchaeota archaeon]|nr:hypothetical protein [Nanoarchaeota archaeon]
MSNGVLGGAFDFLINMGFLNTLVPFILFYAIIFGMLERTQIFTPKEKRDKKDEQVTNLHALIAFSMAITATAAAQAVGITQNYLPILAVTAVALLGIMMLLGMAFGDKFDTIMSENKYYSGIVWGAALLLVVGALIVVSYYSGLLVTPCDAAGELTPVNSLDPGNGECTKLLDITGFPNKVYVMGIEIIGIFASSELMSFVTGLLVFAVLVFAVMWITRARKGG